MRRPIDELISYGLPAERIGGDQQINHIRFKNGAEIILTAIMRLNDWLWHKSGSPVARETLELHKVGAPGKTPW